MNDRERIGQAIVDLCAGTRTETSLLAQIDALATGIGGVLYLSGHSLAEAEALAIEAGEQILDHVRRNWGKIEVAL
jgi:hypothetical protein